MCLSAKDLIAFYASKNIIAAEYLQNVSCDSRPLIHKSRLIVTLSSHSSAVHGACRDKIPGIFYSIDSLALNCCCMIPTFRLWLEVKSATRMCHVAWEETQRIFYHYCLVSGSQRSNSRRSRLCSKQRCQH